MLLALLVMSSCKRLDTPSSNVEAVLTAHASWADSVQYTYVAGVSELIGDTVIVADPRELRLEWRHRLASTRISVGRQGHGPTEWPHPIAPVSLPADSSLLIDPINRRILLLVGTRAVSARSFPGSLSLVQGFSVVGAIGARTLVAIRHPLKLSVDPLRDSIDLLLYDLESAALMPIARLRRAEGELIAVSGAEAWSRPAFAVAEQATTCSDGWIAVARRSPYRVDWRRPDGTWIRGAAIEMFERKLTTEERAFYANRMSWLATQLPAMPPEQRQVRSRLLEDLPPTIPPFEADAIRCGLAGHALVKRTLTAESPHLTLDLVNREGLRIRTFVFDDQRRWVGSGRRGVYVVARDSLGLERLEYYRLGHEAENRRTADR